MITAIRNVDPVKIFTRCELASVLDDLAHRAPRSAGTRMNRVIFRLACCCGLRVSEIGALRLEDVCTGAGRPQDLQAQEAFHEEVEASLNEIREALEAHARFSETMQKRVAELEQAIVRVANGR